MNARSPFAGGVNGGVKALSETVEPCLELEALIVDAENNRCLEPTGFVASRILSFFCSVDWFRQFKIVGGDIFPRNGSRLLCVFFIISVSFILFCERQGTSPNVRRGKIKFVVKGHQKSTRQEYLGMYLVSITPPTIL